MSQLTRLSLANRAVIILLSLGIIGLGLYAMRSLKQELFPDIAFPGAVVTAAYIGASPEVVESEVTGPIEDAVRGVADVTKTTSTSSTGMASVQVEWQFGVPTDDMRNNLQGAIDQIKASLPEDVDPEVQTYSLDQFPVLDFGVASDLENAELSEKLTNIAVPKLNGLPGVGAATVSGEEVRQVQITLRQKDLDRFDVDPSQIEQLFPAYKAQIPAGELSSDGRQINVQVGKTLTSVDDVKNLRLQGTDDVVKLGDVADVKDVPAEESSIFRVDGRPALGVGVTKTTDANVVDVANQVKAVLPELEREIGGNTTFSTIFDQAPYIEDSIKDLATEGGLGLVMAVLVILLFLLAVRPTVIAAISIPMSLLIAMIGLYAGGYTLNMFTLAALTVAIGRVVDDSIVVIENIKRHLSAGEEFGIDTIVQAVREVATAITASTITTVAVFLPIALVSGQTGELFRPFSVAIAVALLASLVVSLTIVPVLAYWFMRPSRRPENPAKAARRDARAEALAQREAAREQRTQAALSAKLAAKEQRLVERMTKKRENPLQIDYKVAKLRAKYPTASTLPADHQAHASAETPLQRGYLPILRWSLRHPLVTIGASILLFVLTMGMTPFLKTDFIGAAGATTLQVTQTLPAGAALAETDEKTKPVEGVLSQEPAIETFSVTMGGSGAGYMGGGGGNNVATYSVTLNDGADSEEVQNRLRTELAAVPDAGEIEVAVAGGGSGGGAGQVQVQVEGADDKAVAEGTDKVVAMMTKIPGMTEVSSDLSEEQSLLEVEIDEGKAADVGMNQATIGAAVAEAIQGTTLGQMRVNDADTDVVLRSGEPVKTKKELEELRLPVTQKQTATAQKDAQDEIEAEQEQLTDEQKAEQERQQDEAEEATEEQRQQLVEQLDELNDQLAQARRTPTLNGSGAPGGAPGAPGAGVPDPGAAAAAQAQQVEALEEQQAQLSEQLDKLDEQIADSRQQRADAQAQADRSEELAERSKDIQDIKGKAVRVRDVAEVREVEAPATIRGIDGNRAVSVTGTPTGDNLGAVTLQLQEGLASADLPSGVTASIGGASADQAESFNQLYLAMGVAVLIVYIVMVATFRSLLQPLILLVSIPFAATGAIGLLVVTGTPLDVASMIGMLMLIGIVVTNAIVLIDLVNKYREQGASADDAVIHGARLRLRPIIMTAAATIGALFPMFLGLTGGGGVFISRPLSVVVIGGLISSTVLTLILVPVLYHLVEKVRGGLGGGKRETAPAEPSAPLATMFSDERGLREQPGGAG